MSAPTPIGRLLVTAGLLQPTDIDAILSHQANYGGRFCSLALQLGLADEASLVKALSRQLSVPGTVVSAISPVAAEESPVNEELARRLGVLPVRVFRRTLTVIMRDPTDRAALNELRFCTDRVIRPLVGLNDPLMAAIEVHFCAPGSVTEPPLRVEPASAMIEIGSAVDPRDLVARPPRASESGPPAVRPIAGGVLPAIPSVDARTTVLTADIDTAANAVYREVFDPSRYRLVRRRSAVGLVGEIRRHRPALVILDLGLDGGRPLDVCRRLKADDATRQIAVVLVSRHHRGWQLRADLRGQVGADEFVEKPFDVQALRARVGRLLAEPAPDTESAEAAAALNRGLAALQHGALAEAAAHFEHSVDRDPLAARPHYYLGILNIRLERPQAAVDALARAVCLDGTYYPAIRTLALLYEQQGFIQKAIETWQMALGASPDIDTRTTIRSRLIELLS